MNINAVIMAAGMSTRFVPLSFDKPKALLKVKGEILIERQIRQLQEANITDITIIIGYLKEQFFYLEEQFGVKLVINEDYHRFNNTSSLIKVCDKLKNTYICSADNYFTQNVFSSNEKTAYYAAVYTDKPTNEYVLTTNDSGLITKVTIGGDKGWYMLGHAYFTEDVSNKFVKVLQSNYSKIHVREQLWESLYKDHINEIPLNIKKYENGIIYEFDSLEELRQFDTRYTENIDSDILNNICNTLNCNQNDIINIFPIKEGLTNTSFRFDTGSKSYVYRHPGRGTELYINRDNESKTMQYVKSLGLDSTFVHIDSEKGWKISHFKKNVRNLNYHNMEEVAQALHKIRKLHEANIQVKYKFDIWNSALDFFKRIRMSGKAYFKDFDDLLETMTKVHILVKRDHAPQCLCHCDCYSPNFMVHDEGIELIDWEYSGMDDPANDLGTFICCSDYTIEEAIEIINKYYDNKASKENIRHCIGYVSIASYYWYLWAIYQESLGKSVGEYLYLWYKSANLYAKKTFELYSVN